MTSFDVILQEEIDLGRKRLERLMAQDDRRGAGLSVAQANALYAAAGDVMPSPFNPRHDFNSPAIVAHIKGIAESMKVDGQLQECVVRPQPGFRHEHGKYELMAGECRWRAATLFAGLTHLRCHVRDVDDKTARQICLMENEKRKDLNPIERARGWKMVLDAGDVTQTELAREVGVTQGDISSQIKLLRLPEEWQALIITGVIGHTQARDHLSAWIDYPQVLKEVHKDLLKDLKEEGEITTQGLKQAIGSCVREMSRPMSGSFGYQDGKNYRHGHVEFKAKPDQLAALEVVEVPTWNGKEKRAMNIAQWEELQGAAVARKKAREQKALDGQGKEKKSLTPQEREEKEEKYERSLQVYLCTWFKQAIDRKVADSCGSYQLELLATFILSHEIIYYTEREEEDFASAIVGAKGQVVERKGHNNGYRTLDLWASLLTVDNLTEFHRTLCRQWLAQPVESYTMPEALSDVIAVAAWLGVTVNDWSIDRAFLELHNLDQLREIAAEMKVNPRLITGMDRETLMGTLETPGPRRVLKRIADLVPRAKPVKGAKKGGN